VAQVKSVAAQLARVQAVFLLWQFHRYLLRFPDHLNVAVEGGFGDGKLVADLGGLANDFSFKFGKLCKSGHY
jgi:hypothetical protein